MVYTIATLFNNKKTMKKTILLTFIAFAGLVATPDRAHACIKALGFLDPLCVISGDANIPLPGFNTGSDQTTNNYTNSNNITNSNVNSNVNTNTNGGTPVYVYDNYNYNNSPLGVSCYSTPTSAGIGDSVIWRASLMEETETSISHGLEQTDFLEMEQAFQSDTTLKVQKMPQLQ